MLVKRRAPWYRDRGIPCAAPDDIWCMQNTYSPYGDGFVCFERALFQKWGEYDHVIDSQHVRFTAEELFDALECRWVEIVVLDEMIALRARVVDSLAAHYSMSRRAGVDMLGVYLTVFRADPLRSLGDLHA